MRPWPVGERNGDAPPTREELGGVIAMGPERRCVQVGPLTVALSSGSTAALRAVDGWPVAPGRHAADADIRLEVACRKRGPFLVADSGERARVTTWQEADARGAATHQAALLLRPSGDGRVLGCEQDAGEWARSLQNMVRIAVAWRLASTRRGLLVHASAVEGDAGAFVFLGPSGSGKSTIARLSRPRPVLADDVVILAHRGGDGACAWPTPLWAEPAFEGRSEDAAPRRVAALLRLRQAAGHGVETLTPAMAAAAVAAHAPFVHEFPSLDVDGLAATLVRGLRTATLAFAKNAGFWNIIRVPDEMRARTVTTGGLT